MLNMAKVGLELIPGGDIFFFRKVWEMEFATFLRDIIKPKISI